MWTVRSIFGCVLFATIASASAQIIDPPKKLVADILAAQAEGAHMYKLDQAAWIASDALQSVGDFRNDSRRRGWLTEETDQGIRVTYYGNSTEQGGPVALYSALVTTNGLLAEAPVSLGEGKSLSEFERAQVRAREKAMSIRIQQCAKHYNTIALLRESPKARSWSFYLMPGTEKKGAIMAGISYRVDVDWQGNKILQQREFSKSCMEIPAESGAEERESAGAFMTHLLDPIPTPIHVFLSLQHHQMIAVLTTKNSLAWIVQDGGILRLDMKEAEKEVAIK